MAGEIGPIAKAFETVFSWFTSEAGFLAKKKEWQGDRLEKAANAALRTWKLDQTPENWRAYKHAEADLVNWSNNP